MASLGQLFGTTDSGDPVVNIDNRPGEARRDIVLRVCYRNTPWALATAHAIGFGIYRDKGLIQHFDEPKLWEEIGYQVDSGTLTHGSTVELERSQASTPIYFLDRLEPQDAVLLKGDFQSEEAQDTWVAEQIVNDLNEGELEPDDIMVVLPSAFTAKSRFARLAGVLRRSGIDCHLVGVGSSADEFFVKDSVAIGHIYRAKGNEAPMVYVLDTQFAGRAFSELSARNIIFYKSELIHHEGPWRDVDQVEAATASWVLWFNTERTHGSIDDLTPLEVEQLDYARNEPVERAG